MSEQGSLDWPGDFIRLLDDIQEAIELLCKKRGAAREMPDVVQVVVMRLWSNRERLRFEKREMLFGYIETAVRHEIPHERARATGRGRMRLMDAASLSEVAPAVDDSSADNSSMDELLGLLDDERMREACRLRFVDGLKLKEVANRLGVSLQKAFRLIEQAKEVLRAKLGASPGSPEAEALA